MPHTTILSVLAAALAESLKAVNLDYVTVVRIAAKYPETSDARTDVFISLVSPSDCYSVARAGDDMQLQMTLHSKLVEKGCPKVQVQSVFIEFVPHDSQRLPDVEQLIIFDPSLHTAG